MTPRQQQILAFIAQQLAKTGCSPSYREIMRHTGMTSSGSVQNQIDILCRDGYLRRRRHRANCLEITRGKPWRGPWPPKRTLFYRVAYEACSGAYGQWPPLVQVYSGGDDAA